MTTPIFQYIYVPARDDSWNVDEEQSWNDDVSSCLPFPFRYPSQFVFVYHGEETLPTPPPSPMDEPLTEELVEGVWQTSNCNNVVQ